MSDGKPNGFFSTEMWIYIGAALFLVALLVSAIVDPELRVLHCLQALIYVVVIVSARRNSPWGYGAGFAIAIVWNGMNCFGPHLIQAGAVAIWSWLRTGHVQQLVPMMVTLGASGISFSSSLRLWRLCGTTRSPGNGEGIRVVDLESRKISIMPDTQGFSLPSWSPDGRYLVAMTQQPSRITLYSIETKAWTELRKFDTPWGFWIWSSDSKSIYMRVVEGAVGVYRLTVPGGKWERVSGLEGVNIRGDFDFDYSLPSLTADGKPTLMSHVGIAQIYSLRWDK
jgi:WD40 repeat protein